MRTKSVPGLDDLGEKGGKLLKNKWVLYGGIGIGALLIGYLYLSNQSSGGSSQSGGYASYTPVDYGASGTPAAISGGGSTDAGSSDALAAAINAANQNSAASNQAALEALKEATNVSIANDQTSAFESQLATQATNYASSTNVASAFLKSVGGGILGVGGSVTPTSAGGVDIGLFADTQKVPLAWGNVLHPIANQVTPAIGVGIASQNVTPTNPINISGGSATNGTG